jgi:hypothetical protein
MKRRRRRLFPGIFRSRRKCFRQLFRKMFHDETRNAFVGKIEYRVPWLAISRPIDRYVIVPYPRRYKSVVDYIFLYTAMIKVVRGREIIVNLPVTANHSNRAFMGRGRRESA